MASLVSILIPAYNAEAWIGDTIHSALAQTWPEKEIIVVDDGSKDQTLAAARQFESKGVRVVTQTNSGAAAARNHAYSLCRGEYVQWLDADDLLAPDKISLQMAALKDGARKTLLSSKWAYFIYRPRKAEFRPTALWEDLSPLEWLVRKLDQNLHMQPATWLVSRELTEAAGPWDTRLSLDDDGEYFCRVLMACGRVQFVPGARMYYRRSGPGSLSNVGRSSKKMESQFLSMQLHIQYIRSLEDSERVRQACLKFLQRLMIYFYPDRLDLTRRMQTMAAELGGRVENPTLTWKYSWIQKAFGWELGKRASLALPQVRSLLARSWDKACFRLEQGRGEAL
jgi:glycosyltransferase involved in cell wall biosynthesis